tara:strand:- start:2203 stop:2628 length:426 start_codon:yes stop_codon:yes gene_type:complete
MIRKEQVEAILKVNGVPTDSPDDQIRSVLLSASYQENEIDAALMVLRENTETHETKVQGLHKVFRTDQPLAPDEISSLLGINVDINDLPHRNRAKRSRSFSAAQVVSICVISVTAAVCGMLFVMYLHEVGVFHPTVYAKIQ